MKKLLLALFAVAAVFAASAQNDNASLYELLDLDRPGLEKVRAAVAKGNIKAADKELQKYFRNRSGITLTDIDKSNVTVNKNEKKWAEDSFEHKFYAHKGYESFDYGKDIDWRLWPVRDNELRWQLHRHYWFIPLAKLYYTTKEPRYIDAWIEHYTDWVKKNPLVDIDALRRSGASDDVVKAEQENNRFVWRPLETSRRMQDQLVQFELTIESPRFTADFLNLFLRMYHFHADYIINHYSKQGNHLLFEAQRMVYAGIYFPEFKDAAKWRQSGIDILNREIGVQVYDDGMQFELDYGYHVASIEVFLKALRMAKANGFESDFPESYIRTVEKMTTITYNMTFPDYTQPLFSDHRMTEASAIRRNFRTWAALFDDAQLLWMASEGRKGVKPDYTSRAFLTSGFFVMRSGWDKNATVAVFKAGPPAFWHNQPDNGTFEYWHRGRNFFPDSGSYVYEGDKEVTAQRAWHRQTRVHNTLTLDGRNLETTDSKTLKWETSDSLTVLVTENQSYADLRHRRSVFFLDGEVMVIADEATGAAAGQLAVHFNLCPGKLEVERGGVVRTTFSDGNNIRIKTLCYSRAGLTMDEGWVSPRYREREKRPTFAVTADKASEKDVLFISVIAPEGGDYAGGISIVSKDDTVDGTLSLEVRVGSKSYKLGYEL
ncbi:MAG: heparinase II/III family protein [Alistipes sp.]|nr:heparinase II/III family protein [Alistipes sp.]